MSNLSLLDHFFPDDKDIHDLLTAAEQKATVTRLAEFAAQRGLYFSPDESRDVIIDVLSRLSYSWTDLDELVHMVASAPRRRARTSSKVAVAASIEDLRIASAEAVATIRERHPGDQIDVNVVSGRLVVEVKYTEMQYGKARLFQPETVNSTVEIEPSAVGMTIRREEDPRAREVVNLCLKNLEKQRMEEIPLNEISLAGVSDPDARVTFFNSVMRGIKGYQFEHLADVKFGRMAVPTPESEAEDDEVELAEEEYRGVVREVLLKGEGVERSREYQDFMRKCKINGFFIAKSTWAAREQSADGDIYVFDMQFVDPETATGLAFAIKWVRRKGRDGTHNKVPEKPTPMEDRRLTLLLEASIDCAFAAIPSQPGQVEEGQSGSDEDQADV